MMCTDAVHAHWDPPLWAVRDVTQPLWSEDSGSVGRGHCQVVGH